MWYGNLELYGNKIAQSTKNNWEIFFVPYICSVSTQTSITVLSYRTWYPKYILNTLVINKISKKVCKYFVGKFCCKNSIKYVAVSMDFYTLLLNCTFSLCRECLLRLILVTLPIVIRCPLCRCTIVNPKTR